MIVAVVLWRIKKGSRDQFIKDWKEKFVVNDRAGLIGEFLSEPIDTSDPRLKTFDLQNVGEASDEKTVLVNVGMWRSVEGFNDQVAKYIKSTDAEKREFEFEVRQRVLLNPTAWRIGKSLLPGEDSIATS